MYHDKKVRVNRNITSPQVRLITSDGTMVGIKLIQDAGAMARAAGLDLVEISPAANPPVCKIMDFSKYLYEKDKQERENRKKQKAGVLKEIRLNPRIASNDLNTKIRHAEAFLKEQNKVRITVIFRGRENQHRNLGEQILTAVKETLSQVGAAEGRPQLMGNRMSIMLSPVTAKPVKPGQVPAAQAAKPAAAPQTVKPAQSPIAPAAKTVPVLPKPAPAPGTQMPQNPPAAK
ncbi:MAG: translation initiation factor IF-3 [Elusimicrobia bacterium]|nr:translation initiation factor IF-3 [Elusimicrobiota bacterium]